MMLMMSAAKDDSSSHAARALTTRYDEFDSDENSHDDPELFDKEWCFLVVGSLILFVLFPVMTSTCQAASIRTTAELYAGRNPSWKDVVLHGWDRSKPMATFWGTASLVCVILLPLVNALLVKLLVQVVVPFLEDRQLTDATRETAEAHGQQQRPSSWEATDPDEEKLVLALLVPERDTATSGTYRRGVR